MKNSPIHAKKYDKLLCKYTLISVKGKNYQFFKDQVTKDEGNSSQYYNIPKAKDEGGKDNE